MIADLKPYADHKEWGLLCLGFVARGALISTDILAFEKDADGRSETCLEGTCHE